MIFLIIIIIQLFFNTAKATNILQLQNAQQAKITITRYIQANENEEIRNAYPNWIIDLDAIAQGEITNNKNNANLTNNTSQPTTTEPKKINVEKIELNKTSITLEEKQQSTLVAKIIPTKATCKLKVICSSKKINTYSFNGLKINYNKQRE